MCPERHGVQPELLSFIIAYQRLGIGGDGKVDAFRPSKHMLCFSLLHPYPVNGPSQHVWREARSSGAAKNLASVDCHRPSLVAVLAHTRSGELSELPRSAASENKPRKSAILRSRRRFATGPKQSGADVIFVLWTPFDFNDIQTHRPQKQTRFPSFPPRLPRSDLLAPEMSRCKRDVHRKGFSSIVDAMTAREARFEKTGGADLTTARQAGPSE